MIFAETVGALCKINWEKSIVGRNPENAIQQQQQQQHLLRKM